MWLINTEGNSFELNEFIGEKKPAYAILSHRWEEEEISFKDMKKKRIMKSNGQPKKGWLKIAAFCELAASRNYHWAWVDTCCIDKSSSAELQESINSMFKWYNDSAICMVYMSDARYNSEHSFLSSQWFKRGWTLQELLAPRHVEFFDAQWAHLGSRQGLCRSIANITNIPIVLLYDGHEIYLSNCSVAQRLSWASQRKTTRAEDQAYCLLGLFGVHMPLLYGEGLPNAFERLQQQILDKYIQDESIFAWTGNEDLVPRYVCEDKFAHGFIFSGLEFRLLAANVTDFEQSNKIVLTNDFERRKPFSISSTGLQAELFLYPKSSFPKHLRDSLDLRFNSKNVAIVPLNCSAGKLRSNLVLLPDSENDIYFRVGLFTTNAAPTGDGQRRDILIRRRPGTENHNWSEDEDEDEDGSQLKNRIVRTLLLGDELPQDIDFSLIKSLSSEARISEEQMPILNRFLDTKDVDELLDQEYVRREIIKDMMDAEHHSMRARMITDGLREFEEQQQILKELKESEEKKQRLEELEIEEQQRIMDESAGV